LYLKVALASLTIVRTAGTLAHSFQLAQYEFPENSLNLAQPSSDIWIPEHPFSSSGGIAGRDSRDVLGGVAKVGSGQALAPQTMRRWMPVAIIGLAAVTAGIALPHALPSAPDAPKSVPAHDEAGKSPLS
jgi:hypothetical protein